MCMHVSFYKIRRFKLEPARIFNGINEKEKFRWQSNSAFSNVGHPHVYAWWPLQNGLFRSQHFSYFPIYLIWNSVQHHSRKGTSAKSVHYVVECTSRSRVSSRVCDREQCMGSSLCISETGFAGKDVLLWILLVQCPLYQRLSSFVLSGVLAPIPFYLYFCVATAGTLLVNTDLKLLEGTLHPTMAGIRSKGMFIWTECTA